MVVGAHALLANGGVIAAAGTALVAAAARKHAVPLVVLVGLHQLSPLFPHDPVVTMNDFRSPVRLPPAGLTAILCTAYGYIELLMQRPWCQCYHGRYRLHTCRNRSHAFCASAI